MGGMYFPVWPQQHLTLQVLLTNGTLPFPYQGWRSNSSLLKSALLLVTHLEPVACSKADVA